MLLVQSSSRHINCEDPNCYIFLVGYILPAGEMNIFLINACRPLEDYMSPNTPLPRVMVFFHEFFFSLEIIFPHFLFFPKNAFWGNFFLPKNAFLGKNFFV